MSTWHADKGKIIGFVSVAALGLISWAGNELFASFQARGETLLDLKERQALIEAKAVDDRALLQECRDGVKEVRDDVKELLRRSADHR